MINTEEFVSHVKLRLSFARQEKDRWTDLLQKVMDYFDPHYGDIYSNKAGTSGGERGDKRQYDSRGRRGVDILNNGIHSQLFSPFRPFFQYTYADKRLLDSNSNLQQWIYDVDQDLQTSFSQSNFHDSVSQGINDYTLAGYMTQQEETYPFADDRYGDLIFRTIPFEQICISEGTDGQIATYFREFSLPLSIMVEMPIFRKAVEENAVLKEKLKTQPDEKIQIIHYITPKTDKLETFQKSHTFISFYMTKDESIPLNLIEGFLDGFEEQSVFTNRWRVKAGEGYPRSAAMSVLGDQQSLQVLGKLRLTAAALAVKPPVEYKQNSLVNKISITPGANNPVKQIGQIGFLQPSQRMDVAYTEGSYLADNVLNGFHVDDFRFPSDLPQMTAMEAQIRSTLQQGQHSPIIARSNKYITSLVQRAFWIRYRAGKYPKPPIPLDPLKFNTEIISPLAKAQRANDVLQAKEHVRFTGEMSVMYPELKFKIDAKKFNDWAAERTNTSFFEFMRTDAEVEEMMQQEQIQTAIPEAAEAVKDLSAANLNTARAGAV